MNTASDPGFWLGFRRCRATTSERASPMRRSASDVPSVHPPPEMVRLLFDEPLSEELCEVLADVFPGSLHVRLLGQRWRGRE